MDAMIGNQLPETTWLQCSCPSKRQSAVTLVTILMMLLSLFRCSLFFFRSPSVFLRKGRKVNGQKFCEGIVVAHILKHVRDGEPRLDLASDKIFE